MKTTLELYNVESNHFDFMTYWTALKEKIKLSKRMMKTIHDKTSTMTYGSEEYDRLYEIYKATEKAKSYNESLLAERKQYDENKNNKKE